MAGILALPFIVLFILGVAVQVLTFRKERSVKPRRIIIGQAAAFISMVVFSIITLRPPGPIAWVILLALGIGGGIGYGSFVNVRARDDGVKMSYTLPWLLVWAFLMVVTQLSAAFARTVPGMVYGLAVLNLGMNLGMNGRILSTYRGVRAGLATTLALALALGLGLGVAGVALAEEPPFQITDLSQLPPEIAPARVEMGGVASLDEILHGDQWWFYEAEGIGEFIHYQYVVDGIPVTVYFSDGSSQPDVYRRVVNIYWFDTNQDAMAALDAWIAFDGAVPWDLGLGMPTARRHADMAAGLSDFLVVNGSVLIHWKGQGGDQRMNPDSPGNIAGTEHLVAILSNVQQIDVSAMRDDWVGGSGDPGAVPPGGAPGDPGAVPPGGAPGDPGTTDDPWAPGTPGFGQDADTPLGPVQSTAAIALSSIILAGGSLLQLDRLDAETLRGLLDGLGPGTARAPDPLAGLPRSENGLVYAEMPWDEGGAAWVPEEDARSAFEMQAKGYTWDKRWGWVTGGQAAERQANIDLGREQWLARDPVADAIVSDIMASREELARTLAEMERAEKIEAIRMLESQAEIDNRFAAIADKRYYWWSGVSLASDVGFTLATGGLSGVVKPLGQLALRGGYHMTAGYTTAWAGNELAGRVWDREAFKQGSVIGLVRTGLDFGCELGFKAARAAIPAVRAAVHGLRGTGEAAEHLGHARDLLREAVHGAERIAANEGLEAGLRAVDRDRALELLREGRRLKTQGASLADLEAAGQVGRDEARLIRQVWTETFDESAEAGAKEVFSEFEQRYGAGSLKQVLLGDQGSSARRFAVGSLKTDADRTVVPVFERELLERVSRETGETLEQVNVRLTDEATDMWRNATGRQLESRGLTLDDFDAGSYADFGRSATADDAFCGTWVMQRQGAGQTLVVRPGDLPSYRAGGQAIVDQSHLNAHLAGARNALGAARVTTGQATHFAGEQAAVVMGAEDVKTAAKGFMRQAWAAGRRDVAGASGVAPDAGLRRLSDALVREPQQQGRLLAEAGFTPETFLARTKAESARIAQAIEQAGMGAR